MKRLILSILAGIVANFVLATATDHVFHITGIYPPYGEPFFDTGFLLLASSYRVIFQIFCSYMAAALAKDRAKQAVWTLGIIGTIAWVAGTIAMSRISPAWYGIVGAVLAIPTSLLG